MNHGSGRLIDLSRLITQKLVTSCNAEVAEKRSPNMKIKLNDMEYYRIENILSPQKISLIL